MRMPVDSLALRGAPRRWIVAVAASLAVIAGCGDGTPTASPQDSGMSARAVLSGTAAGAIPAARSTRLTNHDSLRARLRRNCVLLDRQIAGERTLEGVLRRRGQALRRLRRIDAGLLFFQYQAFLAEQARALSQARTVLRDGAGVYDGRALTGVSRRRLATLVGVNRRAGFAAARLGVDCAWFGR